MKPLLPILAACLILGACQDKTKPLRPKPVILVTDVYRPMVEQLADEGVRLDLVKPMSVVGTTSREAIVALLNDSVATICVDRPLNDEERNVAKGAELKLTENRIADDALVVIVPAANPTKRLSMSSLRRIVTEGGLDWSGIPETKWSGGIEFVLSGRNSGSYELLQRTIFPTDRPLSVVAMFRTQAEIAAHVASHPQSIGIVSLPAAANLPPTVRIVKMETTNKDYPEPFVAPDQRDIYLGLYPLRYSLYLITTEKRPEEGSAFSTFVLKLAGQKIIQKSGLVPAQIPSRSIQITSEPY